MSKHGSTRQATTAKQLRGYSVVAFERGKWVCQTGFAGLGFDGAEASLAARDLREEFPEAIVAILPQTLLD
ncbi:hypothetical protein [Streptomyces sp. NPDC051561]|uniref:hypothetical protein n=1 Tax=Streptomyces sp. NPDC051561 TaxID=3365658 RepID=UPI0037A73C28